MSVVPDRPFVALFEQLCRDAQVPATRTRAEAELTAFQSRDDIVPIAVALVENVSDAQARFHASAALRDAAINRWHSLPPSHRNGDNALRVWALRVVIARPELANYERRAVLRISAALFRRAYGEEPESASLAFLEQLRMAAIDRQAMASSVVPALECLDMCAEEFLSPSLRTAPGVPAVDVELLRRTRPRFLSGAGLVVVVFRAARESLVSTLEAPHLLAAELETRCEPALALLARILTPRLINLDIETHDSEERKPISHTGELSSVLRLDSSWRPLVDQVLEVSQLCFKLIDVAKELNPADIDDLADSARQVILGVSAISRSSYPSPEMATTTVQLILSSIERQDWSTSADSNERIAFAEVWRQLSCSHGLDGLILLGKEVFESFAERTCVLFIAIGMQQVQASQDELYGIMDSADLVLETWAAFSYDRRALEPSVRQVLEPLFQQVFMEYLSLSMKSIIAERLPPGALIGGLADELEEEDLGYDDNSAEESRKNSAAALARFSLEKSAATLVECVKDLKDRVFFCYNTENHQKATISMLAQEDLYFATHLLSAVLADSGVGEVPIVPDAFRATLRSDSLKSIGKALFSSLIGIATSESRMLQTKGSDCQEASPRVGRAILDALNRVSRTYLIPTECPEDTFAIMGGAEFAAQARVYALNKALEGIRLRGFEPEMAQGAGILLKTLSSEARKYPDVQSSEVWKSLLSTSIESYQTLSRSAVENIASALTSVLGDSSVADRLVIPAARALPSLVINQAQLPDSAERCIATINLLKGVARCQHIGASSYRTLAESLNGFDGSVSHCAVAFQPDRYDVTRAAIRLADDMVCGRLSLLSDDDAHKLLSNAMALVHQHSVSVVQHMDSVPLDECLLGIEIILNLLQHILDEQPPVSLSEHVFRGLSSLLPSMSNEFLSYPVLKKKYFDFITCLAAQYPTQVLALPVELCSKIFQSIKLELFSRDTRAERKGLEAITALAREFATKDVQYQSISQIETEFAQLLETILVNLAHGSAFTDNLGTTSDAILHLLFFKGVGFQQHFEAIGHKLMANGGNEAEMAEILNNFRDRAHAASLWQGFKNMPVPQNSPRPPLIMRRLATKEFKEAVFEFSLRCRDVLLRVSAQTAQ